MERSDVIVIGAGVIGAAVACGLQLQGHKVVMLDEGGRSLRASLGNFGLVWVQGKGQGAPRYAEWCRLAADLFPDYARRLQEETGIEIDYRKPGGLTLSHGDEEFQKRTAILERLRSESKDGTYDCEMVDRAAAQELIGKLKLGPKIVGGSYSPHDGYLNPFALLKSFHTCFQHKGGKLHPDAAALSIEATGHSFIVDTPCGKFAADKVVIAAGLATKHLAAMVGIPAPVSPERGQLLVTERAQELLLVPISGIQQTAEGSFVVGLSNEKIGINTETDAVVIKRMAERARNAFPALGRLQVVRGWASLRVLSQDGLPIYQQSEKYPGSYAVTSHSGVTLAPLHMGIIAEWIGAGVEPDAIASFSSRRFDVEKVA